MVVVVVVQEAWCCEVRMTSSRCARGRLSSGASLNCGGAGELVDCVPERQGNNHRRFLTNYCVTEIRIIDPMDDSSCQQWPGILPSSPS